MNWFVNLKTGTKVLVSLGLMLLLLCGAIATGYWSIRSLRDAEDEIFHVRFANAVDLAVLRGNQREVRGKVLKILLTDDPAVIPATREEVESLTVANAQLLAGLRERNRQDEALSATLAKLDEVSRSLSQERTSRIFPLLDAGNREGAAALVLGIQADRINNIDTITTQLVENAELAAAGAVEEAERQADRAIAIFVIIAPISLLVGLMTVALLNHTMARPLVMISALAEKVAAHDLTVRAAGQGRRDEVGVLMVAFDRMVENLRRVTNDIAEGVNVLGAASNEILASTTEVAASASQTASAITQTTTTVEEVRQTAEMSTQKAQSVSENSQRANEVAKQGAAAVKNVTDGMDDVHRQMQGIAEAITRLSEQSQSIGAIIASVDDIAEQSNLLAVNAAIEAAKADEHGKGFAVVASEVRNLAEQSKEATRQVRQILNDIQKGVTTAGMFAEQGSKSVETGIRQSGDAANAIQHLLNTLTEAAHASMHIAASSQQQLVGMDQVAQAMESVRDASQQNVAAIRQVEEASRNIHDLGLKLKGLSAQYKV